MIICSGAVGLQQANAFELDFTSLAGINGSGASKIRFASTASTDAAGLGGSASFKFTPQTSGTVATGKTFDFVFNGGGIYGDSIGDYATLSGVFKLGNATVSAPTSTIYWKAGYNGNVLAGNTVPTLVGSNGRIAQQSFTETATVTSPTGVNTPVFSIKDHHGAVLTGKVSLDLITDTIVVTYRNAVANVATSTTVSSEGITGNGATSHTGFYVLNMTGLTYSGTEKDLQSLAAGDKVGNVGPGRAELKFGYNSTKSLTNLVSSTAGTGTGKGVNSLNNNGSIRSDANAIPDGGVTVSLLGMALAGAALIKRRMNG